MAAPASDPLAQEHQALRREVRQSRREFASSVDGQFSRLMAGAVNDYLRMRADGVERQDALAGLELMVREHWPRGRQREWKYICEDCRDTGQEYRRCRAFARCQTKHDDWDSDIEHDYVSPCHCPQGQKFKRQASALDSEAELVKIGQRRRSAGGWSRPGR